MEFEKFGKIARYNREIIVTEKLDGTNASVIITNESGPGCIATHEGLNMYAGSRNRFITPENDNFGFAAWVQENSAELFRLGKGWHRGEWWGAGIQRRYGLEEKRFSLFNVSRERPECCGVVPILWRGELAGFDLETVANNLRLSGSIAAPGFDNPEGLVVYHTKSGQYLKYTLDGDARKGN